MARTIRVHEKAVVAVFSKAEAQALVARLKQPTGCKGKLALAAENKVRWALEEVGVFHLPAKSNQPAHTGADTNQDGGENSQSDEGDK